MWRSAINTPTPFSRIRCYDNPTIKILSSQVKAKCAFAGIKKEYVCTCTGYTPSYIIDFYNSKCKSVQKVCNVPLPRNIMCNEYKMEWEYLVWTCCATGEKVPNTEAKGWLARSTYIYPLALQFKSVY